MKLIAANGGAGAELLQQAVAAGYDITAVARNPAKLPTEGHRQCHYRRGSQSPGGPGGSAITPSTC